MRFLIATIAVLAVSGCTHNSKLTVDQTSVQLHELTNDNARLLASYAARNLELYDLAVKDNAKSVIESAKKSMQSDRDSVAYTLNVLERKNEVDRNSGDRALLSTLHKLQNELNARLKDQNK